MAEELLRWLTTATRASAISSCVFADIWLCLPKRMDALEYLARIGCAERAGATIETLAALQEAHLRAVPFENLDVHSGARIILDLPRLYTKIVTMRRGGFCYELNGLFQWLLAELGFKARLLDARVYDKSRRGYGPAFDHMLILTEIDERQWIVDVGFGDFSLKPLPFLLDRILEDPNGRFLVEQLDRAYFKVSRFSHLENAYVPQYCFSEQARQLVDFAAMCTYHQTSPLSHFTQKKVCSIATPTGRVTLTDNTLILTNADGRTELPIQSWLEFKQALSRYFHIQWPGPPLRIGEASQ